MFGIPYPCKTFLKINFVHFSILHSSITEIVHNNNATLAEFNRKKLKQSLRFKLYNRYYPIYSFSLFLIILCIYYEFIFKVFVIENTSYYHLLPYSIFQISFVWKSMILIFRIAFHTLLKKNMWILHKYSTVIKIFVVQFL